MPPPPSRARQVFDEIAGCADPAAHIRSFYNPADPRFEDDWLDFKEKPDPRRDPKGVELANLWREALCGFANTDGGVIVWGIRAKKTPAPSGEEIDAACGESLIDDPLAFKSRLAELQRDALTTPLGKVGVEPFPIPADGGRGFVACFVPQGPHKPYRTNDGRRQFYLRAGDNFRVMPDAVLRSMFYPRPSVEFAVEAEVMYLKAETAAEYNAGRGRLTAIFEVCNEGYGAAADVFVGVETSLGNNRVNFAPRAGWAERRTKRGFGASTLILLNPGTTFPAFTATWAVPETNVWAAPEEMLTETLAPTFEVVVYCRDHEPQRFALKFDARHLLAANLIRVTAAPAD